MMMLEGCGAPHDIHEGCGKPGETLFSEGRAWNLAIWGTLIPQLNLPFWSPGELGLLGTHPRGPLLLLMGEGLPQGSLMSLSHRLSRPLT